MIKRWNLRCPDCGKWFEILAETRETLDEQTIQLRGEPIVAYFPRQHVVVPRCDACTEKNRIRKIILDLQGTRMAAIQKGSIDDVSVIANVLVHNLLFRQR